MAPELVGGVGYGNGEVGNVHVAGGDVLTHTGVIGNVLHIEAPDPRVYGNERFEPTATFAIAGITLVGRRCVDPLNENSDNKAARLADSRAANLRRSASKHIQFQNLENGAAED